jgi:hypothetical protein
MAVPIGLRLVATLTVILTVLLARVLLAAAIRPADLEARRARVADRARTIVDVVAMLVALSTIFIWVGNSVIAAAVEGLAFAALWRALVLRRRRSHR